MEYVQLMRLRLLKNGSIWQRGMALLMLVCLSGAACAFACTRHAQAASTKPETAPVETAASMMAGHSCCKRAKAHGEEKSDSDAWQTAQPAPEMASCCLNNIRALSDAPQKLKLDPPALAAVALPFNFTPAVAASPFRFIVYQPQPPPDNRRAYLRHCVFLI